MVSAANVQQLNRELARKTQEEARSNPQSPYHGKVVGIANGQVVVVTDNLDELARRLRQAEPDPSKTFGIEAGRDYDQVEEIWELRRCPERSGLTSTTDLRIEPFLYPTNDRRSSR